eukprot:GFUD01110559.1.p1 GENE.GFUD01110559.1~~GFUD01110559.1.p1  ORF type:complete len:149 (-),score=37.95 GFUD01110559.1:59-505(-)
MITKKEREEVSQIFHPKLLSKLKPSFPMMQIMKNFWMRPCSFLKLWALKTCLPQKKESEETSINFTPKVDAYEKLIEELEDNNQETSMRNVELSDTQGDHRESTDMIEKTMTNFSVGKPGAEADEESQKDCKRLNKLIFCYFLLVHWL